MSGRLNAGVRSLALCALLCVCSHPVALADEAQEVSTDAQAPAALTSPSGLAGAFLMGFVAGTVFLGFWSARKARSQGSELV